MKLQEIQWEDNICMIFADGTVLVGGKLLDNNNKLNVWR